MFQKWNPTLFWQKIKERKKEGELEQINWWTITGVCH